MRQWLEFKGVHKETPEKYRTRIRSLYDGSQGAWLATASWLSLHEPLMGRVFSRREYDVSGCHQLLDLGCGAGQIVRHLLRAAPSDATVVACDLSRGMLVRARERIGADPRLRFAAADIRHLPFHEGTFDSVTCGLVLEYLPHPLPALQEVARVLRPGGKALLFVTENTIPGYMTSHTWKCRTFSRKEFQHACQEAGLPWHQELWFSPFHRMLRLGGILVEVHKPTV